MNLNILPMIGDVCAQAAYEAWTRPRRESGIVQPSWEFLEEAERARWEAVAMASVSTYERELCAETVNKRWRDAALFDEINKG